MPTSSIQAIIFDALRGLMSKSGTIYPYFRVDNEILSVIKKDNRMSIYHPILSPALYLFRLTLQVKGKLSNAYAMGESIDDAYQRYLARLTKMNENASDVEFVDGDLADPHVRPRL